MASHQYTGRDALPAGLPAGSLPRVYWVRADLRIQLPRVWNAFRGDRARTDDARVSGLSRDQPRGRLLDVRGELEWPCGRAVSASPVRDVRRSTRPRRVLDELTTRVAPRWSRIVT